jgi:hypothetical protein
MPSISNASWFDNPGPTLNSLALAYCDIGLARDSRHFLSGVPGLYSSELHTVKHPNTVAFSSSYPVMAQRQTNSDQKISPTQFFLLPIAEVASLLRTDVETGLSQSAITELQVEYGRNTLKTSGGSRIWLSNL